MSQSKSMKSFRSIMASLLLLAGTSVAAERPNIILMMADDLG
ncbi:MAG: hypothetical protein VCA55_13975 [Verrucomicrobiales bacterium]